MKRMEVIIAYEGVSTYIVMADTEAEAIEKAKLRYEHGEMGESTASEWEEIRGINVCEVTPTEEGE